MSPAEYCASSGIHPDHVIKLELRMQYTLVDEGTPLVCDDMVLEIQCRVQKESLWFSGCTKEGESAKVAQLKKNTSVVLWDCLEQDDVLQHTALDEGNDILMPSQTPGAFTYIVAAHTAEPVRGYTAFEMSVGTYAVCECKTENFEDLVRKVLYRASAYLFEVWLSGRGCALDAFLIQRRTRLKQKDCRLQLRVKISDSLTL